MSTEIYLVTCVPSKSTLGLLGCIYQNYFLFCFPLSVPETGQICLISGFLFNEFLNGRISAVV